MEKNAEYSLTRKSKTGSIAKKAFLVAGVTVFLGIGTAVMYNSIQKDRIEEAAYSYDESYETYSEQIEKMLDVDLDSSLEDNLNSMKVMRETIDDYQNDSALISKADSLKVLIDGKNNFVITALDIAKSWCANEWGGNAENYRIVPENSGAPTWLAVNSEGGNHELHGDIGDLAESIGNLQGYNREMLKNIEDPSEFVDTCDKVAKMSGVVATSIAESKSK